MKELSNFRDLVVITTSLFCNLSTSKLMWSEDITNSKENWIWMNLLGREIKDFD